MGKIFIFAGTSEGRRLAEDLSASGIECIVSVATEYGALTMTPDLPGVRLLTGRMDREKMKARFAEEEIRCVVDATHPFAVLATREIRAACEEVGLHCIRLLRSMETLPEDKDEAEASGLFLAEDLDAAVSFLNGKAGNILAMTGAKEIGRIARELSEPSRLYARVLPSKDSIGACEEAGLSGKQIFAMQGPFSEEMNIATLKATQAAFLLTKETGAAGGFPEKLSAAKKLGITAVVIRNPESKKDGLSYDEVIKELKKMLGKEIRTETETMENTQIKEQSLSISKVGITLAGIGPGELSLITGAVKGAIEEADILFGAERLIEAVRPLAPGTDALPVYQTEKILAHLSAHPEYHAPVVLFSGDTGFYSGALSFVRDLKNAGREDQYEVRFLCGISSIVYFCSRAKLSWHDVTLLSRHGRDCNVIGHLRHTKKALLLVSSLNEVKEIGKELSAAKNAGIITEPEVTIGYQLSYPEEELCTLLPEELESLTKEGLYILYIAHQGSADARITPGLSDAAFLRGKAPMTKEEVRAVSLCKLRLSTDSIVYDIGAGTGSVSIEAALLARDGAVYAVEFKDEAYALMEQNKEKFCTGNLHLIKGKAPEALDQLPAPTHAFIGGSAGNMEEILQLLFAKNPKVRVVVNCIALETISQMTALIKKLPVRNPEVVQLTCARANPIGSYHLLQSENPIFIVSFDGPGF